MRDLYLMYLRKSRADNASESVAETLARHESQLQEYCQRTFGHPIPENNIFREVASGETIKERPFMQLLLKRIESNDIKGVIVIEPQRLSRGDLLDCGTVVNAFRYTNTVIITPGKTYDLSDEYDRKFFEMELSRGNDYLEYVKKILHRGTMQSVNEGQFLAYKAPYGYKKISFKKDNGKLFHTLDIVPERADIVKHIFDWYVNSGWGFQLIANELNQKGIQPPKIEHWKADAIKAILQNPVYIGKIRWNHRKHIKGYENGELVVTRPRTDINDCLIVEGKHPALVDEKLFWQAQERIGNHPRLKVQKQLANPLAGLMYCECGQAMQRRVYNANGVQKSLPRYMCRNQKICHTHSITTNAVIEVLISILEENVKNFKLELKEGNNTSDEFKASLITSIKKELEELDKQEAKQFDLLEKGIYSEDIFITRRNSLLKRRQDFKNRLEEAQASQSQVIDYRERITTFENAILALKDKTGAISAKDTNLLLRRCIKKITYHANKYERWTGEQGKANFSIDVELLK